MEGTPKSFAVTGPNGFVGRHLVARLLKDGHRVTTLSRGPAQVAGTTHHQVPDYLDVPLLTRALGGVDSVVHLAARAHVLRETSSDAASQFQKANRDSAIAVALAAREAGVKRVVLISSIGVNGNQTVGKPFTSGDRPMPVELYAQSKWEAEQAVARQLADGPTDFVILRPPLVYGEHCIGNFRLLLSLVHRLPVVPLGALKAPRSFIHVDNLCDAILTAAVHPAASRRTFLVADARDVNVSEVVRTINAAYGRHPGRVVSLPQPVLRGLAVLLGKGAAIEKLAGELTVDSTDFSRTTGWRAPVEPEAGLARTAHWFREAS